LNKQRSFAWGKRKGEFTGAYNRGGGKVGQQPDRGFANAQAKVGGQQKKLRTSKGGRH